MGRYLSILVCTVFLAGNTASATSNVEQREQFLKQYTEVKAGNLKDLAILPSELQQYPLYPWLEYQILQQGVNSLPDAQLLAFAQRYPHSIMADSLYSKLAKRLADKRDWQKLLSNIPHDSKDTRIQCYIAQAQAAAGDMQQALETGKQAWLKVQKSLGDACTPVAELLAKHKVLSNEDYWERIRTAIPKNRLTLASQIAKQLPSAQTQTAKLWIKLRKQPAKHLPEALKRKETPYLREAIAYGLERLARKNFQEAEQLWQQAQQKFTFTAAESAQVESALGIRLALRQDKAAIDRLAAIPAEHRSEDANLWLARLAARYADWPRVLDATEQLQFEHERDDAAWRYWQARALEQTGKAQQAEQLYQRIAHISNFHGFLAADRLGIDYQLDTQLPDRSQRIAGLRKIAAIQRALEWFSLGYESQGRREWFRALKQMDTEGKMAAAELATSEGNPNLAIWTVSRAKQWDAVNLRFPLAHTDTVMSQARKQGVQAAWVLGVMRRESAFDRNAESSAKALGLMQVIPPTARHVAKRLKIKLNGKQDILKPDTNIQLGSAYLSEMLKKFSGNYAQATAAYNAGPARPPKWAPHTTVQADQWIDSIPFTETRNYVHAVMAYTTIYDHKLTQGKGRRLSERLQPINPNASKSKKP